MSKYNDNLKKTDTLAIIFFASLIFILIGFTYSVIACNSLIGLLCTVATICWFFSLTIYGYYKTDTNG